MRVDYIFKDVNAETIAKIAAELFTHNENLSLTAAARQAAELIKISEEELQRRLGNVEKDNAFNDSAGYI